MRHFPGRNDQPVFVPTDAGKAQPALIEIKLADLNIHDHVSHDGIVSDGTGVHKGQLSCQPHDNLVIRILIKEYINRIGRVNRWL